MPAHKVNSPSSPPPSREEVNIFCLAAREGDLGKVAVFLDEYGMKIINEKDNIQDTALTWAVYCGHLDVATLLLDQGASIDEKGHFGGTALVWAAITGRDDAIAMLLERGADVGIMNESDKTAAEIARERGREDMAEMIDSFSNVRKQRLADRLAAKKEQEMAVAAEELTKARLKKLKNSRPSKKILKKNHPRP